MDIGERTRRGRRDGVCELDHCNGVLRFDEMPAAKIAIAKVYPNFDVRRDSSQKPVDARQELFPRFVRPRSTTGLLAVPNHHLITNIPLDAKVMMGDVPAKRRHFGYHRALISSLHRRQRFLQRQPNSRPRTASAGRLESERPQECRRALGRSESRDTRRVPLAHTPIRRILSALGRNLESNVSSAKRLVGRTAPLGSGIRNGCDRSSGYCQLIQRRRPPTSPSGMRRR